VGTLLLAVGAGLLLTTSVLVGSCLRLASAVGFLLAVYVLATTELVAVSLALSPPRLLTRAGLLVSFGALLVVAVVVWLGRGRPLPQLRSVSPALRAALRDRAVVALATLALVVQLYLLVVALAVPQNSQDALLYHLPRAALWKQQHAVSYVADAPDERVDAAPPAAEIEVAASMILSRGDRYATLVQLVALLAACLAIVGIARRLGLGIAEAAFGAVLFSTCSIVVLQTPTALNDLAVAAPLVTCAYFALGRSRTELVLAGLAVALAIATKLTAVLALPVLALFVLAATRRSRWPAVAVVAVAGVALGSVWYGVNLAETGKLDGGLSTAFPQTADHAVDATVERLGRLFRDFLEMSNVWGNGWLRSPVPGLVAGLVVLVLAGVLLAVRRRREAAVATLVAATVVVVTPMLVTWGDVANRAVRQLAVAAGIADHAPEGRVPERFWESTMVSAYGIAFVVLLIGVGPLVVRDVSRRRLSIAAVVAISAPVLFIVVLGLVLEYDAMRMRFVAFPVALTTAVLGLALRVRPLAWTAVGLTAATLAVLVAYIVPRPAGLALLPGNRSDESAQRWYMQAVLGGDAVAFRFLEKRIPDDAEVALDLARDTYIYPAWDAGLERTVLFVPRDGPVPTDADWLVVGPSRTSDEERLDAAGWKLDLVSPKQWRVYSR
jgi:hypothetical protein